jgi:hypothetical protein
MVIFKTPGNDTGVFYLENKTPGAFRVFWSGLTQKSRKSLIYRRRAAA